MDEPVKASVPQTGGEPPTAAPAGDGIVLEVRGVSKRFPGVVALDGVDLDVRQGEVHVLLGETAPANRP
jgi:ABC-type uncharacterized transport system ATPase subunit